MTKTHQRLQLWIAGLGGAVMWLLHLIVAYLIAEFGCVSEWGETKWLSISLIVWMGLANSLIMLCGALVANHLARTHARSDQTSTAGLSVDSRADDGQAFLTRSALLANRIFILIIVVQSIPFAFYLSGC